MNRPLLITDCDEVLLHMLSHFGAWVEEMHPIDFALVGQDFGKALRHRSDGRPVETEKLWPLLNGFFDDGMSRQTLVPHALEALGRIGEIADIVILTNLGDDYHASRVAQLDAVGIRHRVVCNQGGKGEPVVKLLDEYRPSVAVFVDDLGHHHSSVAEHAPQVWRLHMIAEPAIAPLVPQAKAAHARIDDWSEAVDWVIDKLSSNQPAHP